MRPYWSNSRRDTEITDGLLLSLFLNGGGAARRHYPSCSFSAQKGSICYTDLRNHVCSLPESPVLAGCRHGCCNSDAGAALSSALTRNSVRVAPTTLPGPHSRALAIRYTPRALLYATPGSKPGVKKVGFASSECFTSLYAPGAAVPRWREDPILAYSGRWSGKDFLGLAGLRCSSILLLLYPAVILGSLELCRCVL